MKKLPVDYYSVPLVIRFTGIAFSLIILAAAPPSARADAPFARTYVDGPGDGFGASSAYDANDVPAVSYYSVTGDLKFATFNGDFWETTTVADAGSTEVESRTSLVFTSDNLPSIAFYDRSTTGELKLAQFDGDTWNVITIDSDPGLNVGAWCSMARDAGDRLHISYNDATNTSLRYATNVTGVWLVSLVDDTADTGYHTSIALYPDDGSPVITYFEATGGDLHLAYWNGTGWTLGPPIDSDGYVGYFSSVAIGANYYIYIVYLDASTAHLKLAVWNEVSWDIQTITAEPGQYSFCSIALNGAGQPAICYFDYAPPRNLIYGVMSAGFLDSQIVSEGGNFASLSMDSTGSFPLIGYQYDPDFMGAAFVPRPVIAAPNPAASGTNSALKVAVETKIKKLKKKIKKLKKARNAQKAAKANKKLKKLKKLLESL